MTSKTLLFVTLPFLLLASCNSNRFSAHKKRPSEKEITYEEAMTIIDSIRLKMNEKIVRPVQLDDDPGLIASPDPMYFYVEDFGSLKATFSNEKKITGENGVYDSSEFIAEYSKEDNYAHTIGTLYNQNTKPFTISREGFYIQKEDQAYYLCVQNGTKGRVELGTDLLDHPLGYITCHWAAIGGEIMSYSLFLFAAIPALIEKDYVFQYREGYEGPKPLTRYYSTGKGNLRVVYPSREFDSWDVKPCLPDFYPASGSVPIEAEASFGFDNYQLVSYEAKCKTDSRNVYGNPVNPFSIHTKIDYEYGNVKPQSVKIEDYPIM